jgi:hypothetical protein
MVEVFPALAAGTTEQTRNKHPRAKGGLDRMSNEQRPEGMEHDPAALHKDHDTVVQQRAEKEE